MRNYLEYRDFLYIAITLFLQYIVLNIFPIPFNSLDLFLIIAGLYTLKADAERTLLFIFIGGFIIESVYPPSSIIGIKTISALIIGFIFFQLSKKMVIKKVAVCGVIALYCLLTVLTSTALTSFIYPVVKVPFFDYLVFFITTLLASCLVVEKVNV